MTRNFISFQANSWKSENLHIDGLLLFRTYKDLDEKYRRVMDQDPEE